MIKRLPILTLLAIATTLLAASPAVADTGDIIAPQNNPPSDQDGWQAGTCKTDLPHCSPTTDSQFFTQAAGHPNIGFTQFIVKHTKVVLLEFPVGKVKDIRVDLPVGLSVNPQATEQCTMAQFTSSSCPGGSVVGQSGVSLSLAGVVTPPAPPITEVPVYNIVPEVGEPALFGFTVAGQNVFLKSDVEWNGDYHEGFTIAVPESPLGELLIDRLVFNGRAGDGTFLTNPSTCLDPAQAPNQHVYSTYLRADSVEQPNPSFPSGSTPFESPLPAGVMPTGCGNVPFDPGVNVDPGTAVTDSPTGGAVDLTVPFVKSATAIANSNVKTANVSLPLGMGFNPAAAPGLSFCTDAQLGKGSTAPVACPAGSRIGSVAIETPPLPGGSLTGNVYLGEQLSRDPLSGNAYRIFAVAESSRYDVSVRLVGNIVADPRTGRLTAIFRDNPQIPFTSFRVALDGGKGVLTSPPTCGPNTTNGNIDPWSGTAAATPSSGFTLTSAPGGGACAKTMAARPFAPGFNASPGTDKVKTYTNFAANFVRPQGQQELKGVDILLPPGATAKLKGVPYCKPGDIADAEKRSGAAERKNASCPKQSLVGVAAVTAGTGPKPLKIDGKAYLAGPYKGAPLSLVVVTPAIAGPFDLGNVVVRVALNLKPETARINPVAEIPDVYGGAKLDIRSIFVNVNRKDFGLTGTNCRKVATTGSLYGGGADPTNPAAFSAFPVSDPFRGQGCRKLKYKPRLNLRLFGATQRNKNPKLRAALRTRAGDANIKRASVALPHAIFLDQANLANICTRVQFNAEACPKKSVYGKARAFTPLLGKPLEGPVYLRSSDNTLPDLVAHLKGQVDIDLVGRIDTFQGGIRTTFDRVPDVPVTKFVLTLPGGKHGLLVNSTNLCKQRIRAVIQLKGQNGKRANKRPFVKTPCKGAKKQSKK